MIIRLYAECDIHEISWIKDRCNRCKRTLQEIREYHSRMNQEIKLYKHQHGFIVWVGD